MVIQGWLSSGAYDKGTKTTGGKVVYTIAARGLNAHLRSQKLRRKWRRDGIKNCPLSHQLIQSLSTVTPVVQSLSFHISILFFLIISLLIFSLQTSFLSPSLLLSPPSVPHSLFPHSTIPHSTSLSFLQLLLCIPLFSHALITHSPPHSSHSTPLSLRSSHSSSMLSQTLQPLLNPFLLLIKPLVTSLSPSRSYQNLLSSPRNLA